MDLLKQKIQQEGIVLQERILKIDCFLNHQIDAQLMMEIGRTFADRFSSSQVTKIVTIESSGIAPALMTAYVMRIPLVFARKQPSVTVKSEEVYATDVYSYTKEQTYQVTVAKRLLSHRDHVLIIDDFLANGEAAFGLTRLTEFAGAQVTGIGAVVEKAFQPGGQRLQDAGYRLESLVRIASLRDNRVQFVEEEVNV